MPDHYLCLTDHEAALAARGELRAIVRKMKPQPPYPEFTDAIRDIPVTDRWYTASMTKNQWGTEYRPLPSDQFYEWHCPFGAPGTILHLKETWGDLRGLGFPELVAYKADSLKDFNDGKGLREDGDTKRCRLDFDVHWHSPVTLPRLWTRHHPTVKSVRACMAKDVKAGILLDTVGHSWQKLYEKYSETDWLWYAELERQ